MTGWNIRIERLPREIRHQLEASPEYLNLTAYPSLFSDNLEWEMRVPTLSEEWRAEEVAELEQGLCAWVQVQILQ